MCRFSESAAEHISAGISVSHLKSESVELSL